MKRRLRQFASRRALLKAAIAGVSAGALTGCEPLSENPKIKSILDSAEQVTLRSQRLLVSRAALAPEYSESDISDQFRPNGSTDPQDGDYVALAKKNFADFRLAVDGLVAQPLTLSLQDLRGMKARTQITRHDCVEGWSCIGKWTGVPLRDVLNEAGMKPAARFVVFHCFDTLDDGSLDPQSKYYESIDLIDAAHPQTILAYQMNGKDLPIAYGAPLRLRVERQLGYKMAKYIRHIEVVESFSGIEGGHGSYWADRDYEWYAGI